MLCNNESPQWALPSNVHETFVARVNALFTPLPIEACNCRCSVLIGCESYKFFFGKIFSWLSAEATESNKLAINNRMSLTYISWSRNSEGHSQKSHQPFISNKSLLFASQFRVFFGDFSQHHSFVMIAYRKANKLLKQIWVQHIYCVGFWSSAGFAFMPSAISGEFYFTNQYLNEYK